ncbi:MAG: hypothetical protein U0228_23905 [Myxococcaceae bacterium]
MRVIPLCLALSFLALAGCSATSTKPCSPASCAGCCDANGQCASGNAQDACGTGGLVCTQCIGDTVCNLGFCVQRQMQNGGGNGGGGGATGGGTGGGVTGGGLGGGLGGGTGGGTGGGSSTCGPSNCTGCCNGNLCVSGSTRGACGSRGLACAVCSSEQTCVDGACTSPATCNASTCPGGCCIGSTCVAGTSNSACGALGQACNVCGDSESCVSHACTPISTCNASTCPSGCCQGNVCLPGTSASSCGSGGAACSTCSGTSTCTNQACTAPSTCNVTTCPSGCCQGNVCLPGTSTSSCGTGGATCSACGSNQTCASGQCTFACNATTCPGGCCQGGVCLAGTTSAACGTGGAACASCTSSQVCNGTSCAATCNATTCPGGCCQGDVCLAGTSTASCGSGGAACVSCTSGQTCSAGTCSGGSLPGDTCATATLLSLPASVSHSLVGFSNDFVSGTVNGCRGTQGVDRMYRLSVPAGERLTVTITPAAGFDPTLSLVTGTASACVGTGALCAASADLGNAGDPETLTWTNTATTQATVYLVVEDYSATGTNQTYTLAVSSAPPTSGESCSNPIPAISGSSVSRSPASFLNDYEGAGTGCFTPSTGPDFVLSYTVPNNRSLTVTATPASGLDVSLSLATSVAACGARTCVAGSNTGAAGVAETIGWNNTTGSTQTLFVIVDAPTSPSGTVSVLGTEGALLGCGPTTCPNGCCSGGQCVTGTSNSACGTGGVACSACTSPAQCSASQACSATDLPTGSSCTAANQCYQPILGTAECRTTWPGGYCTGSCLLTEQACGGFLSLATGWCTPAGECLQDCANPGTGQSSCRTGYVCDYSNGVGSQGVCIPRCQQVACASGTCNASGYCR